MWISSNDLLYSGTDGYGTLFYQNGDKIVGHFENGIQKGFGEKLLANGTIIKNEGLLKFFNKIKLKIKKN
jgi:hypothetical protein